MASPFVTLRRLGAQLLGPLRDQSPVSLLIRETAKKDGRLIIVNLICSLLNAAFEGLTFAVVFMAVKVLSKPNEGSLGIANEFALRHFPEAIRWLNQISAFQAFSLLIASAVILKILQGAALYFAAVSIGYFANRASRSLTSLLHSQVLSFSFPCASRYRIGELQYINNAGPGSIIAEIITYNGLFVAALMLITYLVVLVRLSPWLLLAAIGLGLASTQIQRQLLPRATARANVTTEISKELGSRMAENIQGLRLLHTSGCLDEAAAEVERQTHLLEHNLRGQTRLNSINAPVTIVLPMIMIAGIAWLSLVFFGQKTSGVLPSLVTFVVALQRLNGSLGSITDLMVRFKNNSANLKLLNEFLLHNDKEFRQRTGTPYNGFSQNIVFQHVGLTYGASPTPALRDINLILPNGHTIALVGRSGAGKSSIADLLAGLYEETEGRILIDGVDLRSFDLTSWQRRIGVVSQDTFLFNASIAANISFGTPGATLDDVIVAARQAQAAGFIEALPESYNTLVGERGYRLSGGQRQRISLARAILRNPDLLILDEATSALDTESERLVQEAIDRFDRKHTILVIAHRLSTIVNADCIYVMDQGRIVEQGNHQELLRRGGRYAALWQQQIRSTKPDPLPLAP
ncbi:MAG: ABC transporter ATP-binding protein/permease [Cyanobacteriota bacterium]|nr:ABC transporter ATP-binding protein/permease [Cyanobacteriota bacterium]